jgi:hypothetical protein
MSFGFHLTEIKTVPYVPLSHPFVERLIGSFVVLNKSPVLLRIPLCGADARAARQASVPLGLSTT